MQGGLTSAEVAHRIADGLTNSVDESSSRSLREILISNVFTRFNAILGILFVVVMIAGSIADALFGLLLVANSLVGIVQELLAKRKLDALSLLHSPTTRVIRDGNGISIPTQQVVQDDLIELRAGDQVPADGKVLRSEQLEINEANLTGEIDAVAKAEGDPLMSGTIVTAGHGFYVAASVGATAYAHRIAAEAKIFKRTASEIRRSIDSLLKYITWAIVIATPLQLWSQFHLSDSGNWRDATIRATAGLVGLVPEGLVLLTTLAFLTAAVQLTRQQVLVQELPAVEGLARVSVICLDKTGTLTTGQILFENLEILNGFDLSEVRAALGLIASDPAANGTLSTVASAVPVTSEWKTTASIPFDSSRKWQAVEFEGHGTWAFGAPDVLLQSEHEVAEKIRALADSGRRVLLLCHTSSPISGSLLPTSLEPAAYVVLKEEVRADAGETLAYFAAQGVGVKIISGDNPATVAAITRNIGIDVGAPIDARTLGTEPKELVDAISSGTVFGRVSPEQKRSFIQALQSQGEVVAMTGDGVNDALALKHADIGIAMNNGASATKAVAQLILLDGQFSHLPNVVAEGRRVIGNVERVANLFVAKNVMSFVAILSAALISRPFPLLPRHLTLLSSITIGIPAFVLALGPNARRYQSGFMQRVLTFALPAGAVAGITVVIADFVAHQSWGVANDVSCSVVNTANTDCWRVGSGATLAVLIVFFWILILLARPLRAWKLALVSTMIGIGVFAYTVPFASNFFNFNLPLRLMLESSLIGLAGIAAIEISRRVAERR
jgi:cation-transporting ATPase E